MRTDLERCWLLQQQQQQHRRLLLLVVVLVVAWSVWTTPAQAAAVGTWYGSVRSCADVMRASQQQGRSSPKDGEYLLTLPGRGAVSIYCAGFNTGSPREYLTLVSGRGTNFAEIYGKQGENGRCQDKYPQVLYADSGRSEFYRIRLHLPQLIVDLNDPTFAVSFSVPISYGTAGDMFAWTASCGPMGRFSVDLRGTPFILAPNVTWHWAGHFADGTSNGQAFVHNNAYIGCFQDAGDRLLPTPKLTSGADKGHMTPDTCSQACSSAGFGYAGIEYSKECYCGDSYSKHSRASESECKMPCAGDRSRSCGGSWRISVYATDRGQTVTGRCGGYPATCYPVIGSQSSQPAMQLALSPRQPCLHGACQQNELCIAITPESFRCVTACNATSCDVSKHAVVSNTVDCPMGLLPVQCACATNTCTGARFNNDRCLASTGKSQVTCINGDPGHVLLTDVQGLMSVHCPNGTTLVGCSYWDSARHHQGNGVGTMATQSSACSVTGCPTCTVHARCQAYVCGCQNGATCNPLTGQCACSPGYYGDQCQLFDYCGYYEDHNDDHASACSAGTCQAVPALDIHTLGGGQSDTCVFPFTYDTARGSHSPLSAVTYTQCVSDNLAGPPFACGTYFDGVDDTIDLGTWSPGAVYTLATWVSPGVTDARRRIILGAGWNCRDFGLAIQNGRFLALYSPPGRNCTASLQGPSYQLDQWYLVAVTNNGTTLSLYVDRNFQAQTQVRPMYLPTSEAFHIGSSKQSGQNFKGYIKSVKVWKRSLQLDEIQNGMTAQSIYNSTHEALVEGLVAHYELGQVVNVSCQGIDHGGDDWTLLQDQEVSGVHCNVNRMTIGQGITVQVAPYDGTNGGSFEVYAEEIYINGYLTAEGRGYRGGQRPTAAGANGLPGESYHTANSSNAHSTLRVQFYQPHRGGGGGGQGAHNTNGNAGPGGGGGYASAGGVAQRSNNGQKGQGGQSYGTVNLDHLYLGSGGGSGGNAHDLTHSPRGGQGGSGGGAIGLYARGAVQISGHVSVAGGAGQGDTRQSTTGCTSCPAACHASSVNRCYSNSSSTCWDSSGPGGGGSGGSLYIVGSVVDVGWDRLWEQGGSGGLGGAGGCGGDGARGRIRVDAVTFRGQLPPNNKVNMYHGTTHYQDLSVPGQKLIRYNSQLAYGNEVYLGCFQDDVRNRHFAYTVPITATTKRLMTPQYCMQQCRQKGYAFSAIEYAYECYCDNAFKSSLIKHENECNQACTGDRRQVCGAPYRMSVYGPKSFLPVEGANGAVQRCRPWCLTGNLYSPSPSWGYCDLSSETTTSFAIRCQCPDGFQGGNCDQPCPEGSWGTNCMKRCVCNDTNTAHCNPEDGTCQCRPGFEGNTCDLQCPPGFYGSKCSGRCSCSETADCDFITGQCKCKAGWRGELCNFPCPPGTYGANCSGSCTCFQGSCSPEDGTCSCDPGFKLPFCRENCDPSNYGPNCLMVCDCHGQPCDPYTGICRCGPGFTGRRCETICPHGKYGQGCQSTCQCQNGAGCDHVDGECFCTPGWSGEHCERTCPPYQYGSDCADHCTCAQLNSEGCDGVTGACTCRPGFTGNTCALPCPEGYYGANCLSRCNCYNNAPCDKVTGQCQCGAGFTDDQCQTPCPATTYGTGCTRTCPSCSAGVCSKTNGTCICADASSCTCPPGFYGSQCQQVCQCIHGSCDPHTGQCNCDPGWQGQRCDAPCPSGTYGRYCLSRCQCRYGNCSTEDGSCTCLPGYQGDQCDTFCTKGTFGVACAGQCQPCGPGALQQDCDPVTGNCICKPGYTGLLCDRPCPYSFYGDGCSQQCSCVNGYCNNVDGTCDCPPGFTGQNCDQQCRHGFWGPGCNNTCACSGHWSSCDVDTGECQCAAGFTGDLCLQTCPLGTYGTDCENQCACDTSAAECSPIDGSCLCRPGFHGPTCELCPINTYGVNCSQTCDCSGHGSCDNHGLCDCEAGFTGDHCQTQCEQDLKWGKDCREQCDCSGQSCNFRTGICRCDPGKQGRRCDQACDKGYYGLGCAQVCQCQHGATCNAETGQCHCPPGVDGRYCNQDCPVGRYGTDCSRNCPCAPDTACDRQSGKCQCQPGFTGPGCNISCPSGRWDVNCAMTCSPTCKAGCLPDTGQCKCTPDSCPHGYFCQPNGLCDTAAYLTASASASGGLSAGQISGIVIGFILATVVVGLAVFFFMRHHNQAVVNRLFAIFKSDSNGTTAGEEDIQGTNNPMYMDKVGGEDQSSPATMELPDKDISES